MGIRSELNKIILTEDHISRAVGQAQNVDSMLRSVQFSLNDARRGLEAVLAVAAPNDPNRKLIEAQIEALS